MKHAQRFTLDKIKRRLELIAPAVTSASQELPEFRFLEIASPEQTAFVGAGVDTSGWQVIEPHSYWGRRQANFVLRTTFAIPEAWDPELPTALYLPLGDAGDFSHPEALVYIDGESLAACDRHHQEISLPKRFLDGKTHSLALQGWTGLGGSHLADDRTRLYMRPCALVQIHPQASTFYRRASVAFETALHLKEDDPVRGRLLNILDETFSLLDTRDPLDSRFYDSIAAAAKNLDNGIRSAGAPMDVTVHAAGHAHIDVAWLWTLGQTRQKAARTFHTVLRYMEQFPEYRFTQSQPQLYEYVRQDFPELFSAIRARALEGRWETIGGMWIEADCNLTGAEALARQFLLGRSFFKEHFGDGAESPVLWLPDVFGYAWALPQLIRLAGLKYFMTIKIGWNQYNRLPYDTFWWQGIDGSKVLTHFSTTPEPGSRYGSTYNSKANPEAALGTWRNFLQKESHSDLLMAYGYGDGGGGPTREMIENIEQMADFPGLPKVQFDSVRSFFEAIDPPDPAEYPTWNGELYLEYHRGTYTTQARNKRANRKAEFALHDAEFLSTLATLFAEAHYPRTDFTALWRTVCLNQFHDIIPGSSIGEVYVESQTQYAEVFERAAGIRRNALEALAGAAGAPVLVVNPSPFNQAGPVFIAGDRTLSEDERVLPSQPVEGGRIVQTAILPPHSLASLETAEPQEIAVPFSAAAFIENGNVVLENALVRAVFDERGDLVRFYDRLAKRDVLQSGAIGNEFQAFEDRPLNWDAWDIDIFYEDKRWGPDPAETVEIIEAGPLRAKLRIRRRILSSSYTQEISLDHNSAALTVKTDIHWVERHVLLKVAFPVEILAPHATYEIQWGSVQRPTHRNTSWDWARFETCAQKWVDLSEGDYGVSLINDCKYGHDVHENVLRLSLLRSPTSPDPEADQGSHTFTYQLLPHRGPLSEETLAAAYALNDPLIVHETEHVVERAPRRPALREPIFSTGGSSLVIETVKIAEDGDGVIVRLFESRRRRGTMPLDCAYAIREAWVTNLLEESEEQLVIENGKLVLAVRPFQIITLRLKLDLNE